MCVRLKTAAMADWAKMLMYDRIPVNVSDPKAMDKAAALAKQFVKTHPWALAQEDEFDLDELCKTAVEFARSKGYDLLDEPPCVYTPAPSEWIRRWGPET